MYIPNPHIIMKKLISFTLVAAGFILGATALSALAQDQRDLDASDTEPA